MLGHLPHPTLHPNSPSVTDGISGNDSQTRLRPRTATRPWEAHRRSDTTSDFASIPPSSRSSSPSRSSTFLPFLKLAKDRSISPEPVSPEAAAEFEHTLTGEKYLQAKAEKKPGKLASWFSGNSEPVNITLIPSPVKEKQDPFFDSAEMEGGSSRSTMSQDVDTMMKRPLSRLLKDNSSLSVATTDLASSNKFAFWRSRPATNQWKSNSAEDELTGLDIQTALFPSGMIDNSSPEKLKNLQGNAESSIVRFQTAYQKSLQLVREVTSEKNALTDELEVTQTRSEHLKLQLAIMAARAANQDSAMQSMAEELAALRCRIREDAEFRSRSLRIVTKESSDADDDRSMGDGYYGTSRPSTESFASADSSPDSVFSQAHLGTCTPISAADTSPELCQSSSFEPIAMGPAKECQNCHGVRAAEAWDVVHVLKEESRELKARIAQCESANEDALNLLEIVSTVC